MSDNLALSDMVKRHPKCESLPLGVRAFSCSSGFSVVRASTDDMLQKAYRPMPD
jgi:hypothetical protein